ncbi:helix-turn-helix domain-containing protein [Streptococcus ictaluri]|uniref:PucR C-terminal helix-turn-helix domain-containing protein n=1 Tax=Streptococcus ictaluri 707-05 TaxID=764299 RepID=G5K551_9STRE|nr:hypothetical protein STRIC_1939 [Streptococcus ictaluri 707-05]
MFVFDLAERVDDDILSKVDAIYSDYYETLIVFAKENSNYLRTSQKLHIHRNTLSYRLNRIKEETGLDPCLWYQLTRLLYYFSLSYLK